MWIPEWVIIILIGLPLGVLVCSTLFMLFIYPIIDWFDSRINKPLNH